MKNVLRGNSKLILVMYSVVIAPTVLPILQHSCIMKRYAVLHKMRYVMHVMHVRTVQHLLTDIARISWTQNVVRVAVVTLQSNLYVRFAPCKIILSATTLQRLSVRNMT